MAIPIVFSSGSTGRPRKALHELAILWARNIEGTRGSDKLKSSLIHASLAYALLPAEAPPTPGFPRRRAVLPLAARPAAHRPEARRLVARPAHRLTGTLA